MDTKINYNYSNIDSDKTILFLHGWGQNISMMRFISKYYFNYYNILEVDLPGFGLSNEPSYSWNLNDYVNCINELIKELKIKKLIIIGHSFGGKIAMLYASRYNVYKLICFGSNYTSEIKKIPFKIKIYKLLKKVKLFRPFTQSLSERLGSNDYKLASNIMRGVLVKSINYDMEDNIKNIKCSTLLIWGELDTAVPINRAYEINKLIKNSALIIYEGKTHYAYLEDLNKTILILDSFLNVARYE